MEPSSTLLRSALPLCGRSPRSQRFVFVFVFVFAFAFAFVFVFVFAFAFVFVFVFAFVFAADGTFLLKFAN